MTNMKTCFDMIAPPYCVCVPEIRSWPYGCYCCNTERTLRAYAAGHAMPPMTTDQREGVLYEIDCVEGYSRKDYESCTDQEIAKGVLMAWADYCRDKGLL